MYSTPEEQLPVAGFREIYEIWGFEKYFIVF